MTGINISSETAVTIELPLTPPRWIPEGIRTRITSIVQLRSIARLRSGTGPPFFYAPNRDHKSSHKLLYVSYGLRFNWSLQYASLIMKGRQLSPKQTPVKPGQEAIFGQFRTHSWYHKSLPKQGFHYFISKILFWRKGNLKATKPELRRIPPDSTDPSSSDERHRAALTLATQNA